MCSGLGRNKMLKQPGNTVAPQDGQGYQPIGGRCVGTDRALSHQMHMEAT